MSTISSLMGAVSDSSWRRATPARRIHPAQCREQQDAAIAILEVGWMNDGVQQQTRRAEFLSAIAPEFWTERANTSLRRC
jgi:hypothetical protein